MGERDHGPAVDYLRLGCRLAIVGGVRERVVVGACWALAGRFWAASQLHRYAARN